MSRLLPLLLASAATAHPATAQVATGAAADPEARRAAPAQEVFSTGVARGRDRLDSATSTSALKGSEAEKLGPRPLADILRTMPGLRVESAVGEGNANYTVRGLPLAAGGSKYMQIQEDGLPVVEFGDFFNFAADVFSRADFNLAQIETIRGGSASTFASNSPGGLINLISKTGEVAGGSVQLTKGLDYGENRVDADYGGKLTDSLFFHAGGFYRRGEGPREIGFTGYKGGQIKLNVTKRFSNGYIRVHGKYLDDRSPTFAPYFFRLTGTDSKPVIANLPNFDIRKDSVLSPNIGAVVTLDGENKLARFPLANGMHPVSKSVGVEGQFEFGGWTFTDRARFSANSGDFLRVFPNTGDTAAAFAMSLAGTGATARYATGPNAGQLVPADANGNGLLALYYMAETRARNLDNLTNDFRATRVARIRGGNLTVTGGVYKAIQKLRSEWLHSAIVADVAGDAATAMVDLTRATGAPETNGGYYAYGRGRNSRFRRIFDVEYDITAPYGSFNYHAGKIAVGGSLRYDIGKVRGSLFGADLGGGRVGLTNFDITGDGVLTAPERSVAFLPLSQPAPVAYDYGYLSYSAGVNYRIAEPLSVFARYSRGGRANADKILFTPLVNTVDGSVAAEDKYDEVRQLEGGMKFRQSSATLNATAFLAHADDHNVLNGSANQTIRAYRAYGLEVEGGYRAGPFSFTASATYTKAKITEDKLDPALTGKEPRHQPALTFAATPQFETDRFTLGANIVGITSSYAQDSNLLKMPGFTTVNGFMQFRPVDSIQLMVNATNLFDTIGFFEISQATMPANGLASGRAIHGRTVSASLRYSF